MNSTQLARLEDLHMDLIGATFHTGCGPIPPDYVRDDPILSELDIELKALIAKVEKHLSDLKALPDWAGGTVPVFGSITDEMLEDASP